MRKRIAGLLLLLPLAASADEKFRCGSWIASSDLTVAELLQKCGEPASKTIEVQDVWARNQNYGLRTKQGETTIEKWTYNRGSQAKPMVVTIIDGKIKSIDRQK